MSTCESRSSSVSTDYELIQPRADRLSRGYSIRESMPPYHRPPNLHNIQQQSRSSSKRLRNLRLSASRQKKYTGLQWNRQVESAYATPSTRYLPARRDVNNTQARRYDGFFRGSISEENEGGEGEEEEEGEGEAGQSITIPSPDTEQRCKARRCVVCKTTFCVIVLVLALLVSLAALGLTLYGMFSSSSSSSTDCNRCDFMPCTETVTMAHHGENCTYDTNTTYCTTEALTTNITVSKSVHLLRYTYNV